MKKYMSLCGKLKVMEVVGMEGKILDTKTRATVEVTETPNTFPNGYWFRQYSYITQLLCKFNRC